MNTIITEIVLLSGLIISCITGIIIWQARQLSAQNNRIATAATVTAWLAELRSWASDSVSILAEARYSVVNLDNEVQLTSLKHRLSAVIDRGRFFFPNQPYVEGGQDARPIAYRGSRHPVLDPLVAAICLLEGKLGKHSTLGNGLVAMQREFVSRVQQILNPEETNERIRKLVLAARDVKGEDKTLGELLNAYNAPGANALLHGK